MRLPETASALDPRGYLDRINFPGEPDSDDTMPSAQMLGALHEAHMLAVPFENLSIHYGQPIVLEEAALYDKIVRRNRGGFCYELNGMFAWLLRQLGYDVTMLSAEVAGSDGTFSAEFDHLALLVRQVDGADWLADVGFGDSFRQPLRFEEHVQQDGAEGHVYRLYESEMVATGHDGQPDRPYLLVEQRRDADAESQWEPVYRFTLQPRAWDDFIPRCHYHQTSPDSHFTQKRICSLALPNGRVSLSDLRLITTLNGEREEQTLPSEDAFQATLAERFGIVV